MRLTPLTEGARVLSFRTGSALSFSKEIEAGLTYICPRVRERFGVAADRDAFVAFLRGRFEESGYQTIAIITPLTQDRYYGQPVYAALAPDRTHEVKAMLNLTNERADGPFEFDVSWEQRCNG